MVRGAERVVVVRGGRFGYDNELLGVGWKWYIRLGFAEGLRESGG